MHRSFKLENPAFVVGLTLLYFVAGKLALKLAFLNASASAVWPCTGIALAALLIFGVRLWPAIFAGAFLVNFTTAGTALTSLGIATGNTLEALAGCCLVTRFAAGRNAYERSQNIFKFVLLAGMLSTAISASIGTATLLLGGLAEWSHFHSVWITWWLGDGVGSVIVTPFLLLWFENPRFNWTRKQMLELAFLFFGLFSTAWFVFGESFHVYVKNYPFEYLCFPFLVWAAFRFGRRKTATATCALAIVATWGTVHGYGPFARNSANTSLLLLQSFMAIVALTSMVLAAETTEHKRAEDHVRHLAGSDPLTGLANYRRLIESVDSEIKRYSRSRQSFAIILFDLDRLKKINDTHGHLVGSRALCRLADILRLHSREIDLAARYGGDEFVLVLPETSAEAAIHVASRVSGRLRNDGQEPPLSVSAGVAVYPTDGQSLDELFTAADRALYIDKSSAKPKIHLPM
ncbi:MAG TPA: MASE1 domain-containing protein [Candidatus Acidoferrum sp.]|jgi:diguanylate cyclase (GGDEF)-like protein